MMNTTRLSLTRDRLRAVAAAGLLAFVGACALPDVAPPRSEAATTSTAPTTPAAPLPPITTEPPPAPLPEAAGAYDLQPGDILDVRYVEQPLYDRESVQIAPDGSISLPFVGSLRAAGRTLPALEDEVRQRHAALASPGEKRRYLLQAGDEIELKFPYAQVLNELVRLRPDGAIQLRLVGTIQASPMTPEELERELNQRYARFLRNPSVAVIVRNTSTQMLQVGAASLRAGAESLRPTLMLRSSVPRQVFVGGEVNRPGVLVYRPGLTLEQAVIEAGGHRQTAETQRVMVLRRAADGSALAFERDLTTAVPQDMALAPSDVVVLPKTRVAGVSQMLDEYVFKIFPFIRNSSFSWVNDMRQFPR